MAKPKKILHGMKWKLIVCWRRQGLEECTHFVHSPLSLRLQYKTRSCKFSINFFLWKTDFLKIGYISEERQKHETA